MCPIGIVIFTEREYYVKEALNMLLLSQTLFVIICSIEIVIFTERECPACPTACMRRQISADLFP